MLVNGFAGIQIIQCYLNLVSAESLEVNLFYESPLHFILPYKSKAGNSAFVLGSQFMKKLQETGYNGVKR